jgi:hypothetical protein
LLFLPRRWDATIYFWQESTDGLDRRFACCGDVEEVDKGRKSGVMVRLESLIDRK